MALLGLRHFADRVGDDGIGEQLRLDAEGGEELVHEQPAVAIALGSRPLESPGTLFITTKKVLWLSDVDRSKGYAVDFVSVSLHAVSRDPEAYPLPCIYTQIERDADESDSADSDEECHEGADLSKITEMRLVPSDPSQLDTLFRVFCKCAELNPDPNEETDEEKEWVFGDDRMAGEGLRNDSHWHFSEEHANPIGYTNGNRDLADTVLELQINDDCFEDAEESGSHMQSSHK